jgi:hypothetical protein
MDTAYKQNKAILLNKWHDFGSDGLDLTAETRRNWAGIDTQHAGTGTRRLLKPGKILLDNVIVNTWDINVSLTLVAVSDIFRDGNLTQ